MNRRAFLVASGSIAAAVVLPEVVSSIATEWTPVADPGTFSIDARPGFVSIDNELFQVLSLGSNPDGSFHLKAVRDGYVCDLNIQQPPGAGAAASLGAGAPKCGDLSPGDLT